MGLSPADESITIRAALSAYVALCGIWVALAVCGLVFSLQTPGKNWEYATAIAGGGAILWWAWLQGFRIVVARGVLEYRDGLFRSSRIALAEIAQVKVANIEWNNIGRAIKIPRIVVIARNGEVAMQINPKPFRRSDLQIVRQAIGHE